MRCVSLAQTNLPINTLYYINNQSLICGCYDCHCFDPQDYLGTLTEDFILDNEAVDNVNQPSLAAALNESLQLAGRLPENALATTNYGICATVNEKLW